jgi:hypothetical protein
MAAVSGYNEVGSRSAAGMDLALTVGPPNRRTCVHSIAPRSTHLPRLLVAAWLLLAAGAATARIVVPAEEALPVLASIEAAVLAGDHEAMAGLLSSHGVRLNLGPTAERSSDLTPSQAFYYFKTLFQDRQSIEFTFEKHQEVDGGRLHAVAAWRFTAPSTGSQTRQRVLFTLAHGNDGWKVTEITAWR